MRTTVNDVRKEEVGVASLVLAVDDEPAILRLVKLGLVGEGFRVITAENGADALALVEQQQPDAVILDVVMPGMTGLELMQKIRTRGQTPIILLTGRRRDEDVVRGLELGADDYLGKPFNPAELCARVRTIIRRESRAFSGEEIVRVGNIEIDLIRRTVRKNDKLVSLTRTEWLLIHQLASHPGTLMTNTELLTKVWGPEYIDDLQYLRVWFFRLRGKLEEEPTKPKYIKTIPRRGYLLDRAATI